MNPRCVMRRTPCLFAAVAIAVGCSAPSALGQSLGRSYDIIAPEPWLPPRHRSIATPRNPSKPAGIPDYNRIRNKNPIPHAERIPKSVPLAIPQPQAPTVVPGLGSIPNLPPLRGLGATESFNDRAARCAHQAGVFGVPAGQTGVYIRSCAN